MATTARAVERLNQTHTAHLESAEYECAPLLEQLREAISSSMGAGSGCGGTGGNLLNLAAHELWELIDGITRGWLREWGVNHTGDLPVVLQRLPHAIQAQHAAGAIDDDFRDRLNSAFTTWVTMIEDLFDPPRQKELTAPCPKCGERDDEDGDTRRAAIVIPSRRAAPLSLNAATAWHSGSTKPNS